MTESYGSPYGQPAATAKFNTLAIVGFVLSFFISIAGLICCIIAINQINERGERGKGLAIAGIVISALSIVIAIVALTS